MRDALKVVRRERVNKREMASHPLIQACTVSRNHDDTALQGDHRATFNPERAGHKQPGS
jgi:hypothetical protein